MASSSRSRARRGPTFSSSSDSDRDQEPAMAMIPDILFETPVQAARYNELRTRQKAAQKFVDIDTLRELKILNQLRTLFRNIGMEGILNLRDVSYLNPTCEFLSSLRSINNPEAISFRLFNVRHTLTVAQICELIDAPSDHHTTYATNSHLGRAAFRANMDTFWESITGRRSYNSSSAKASWIIHPVLRVAHRIIASIFFPQEETSKCGLKELELLYYMVHRPEITPNFGHFLIYKLLKVARSGGGQVHCGGIITILAKHPSLNIHFPEGLEQIRGARLLNIDVLTTMNILRQEEGTIIWRVGRADYLSVAGRNNRVLSIRSPPSATNWLIESNLGAPHHVEPDQEEPQEPVHQHPPHHAAHPGEQPNYMAEFTRIQGSLDSLATNFGYLTTSVEELDNNYVELNERFTSYHDERQLRDNQLFSMVSDLHRLSFGNPSGQASTSQNLPSSSYQPPFQPAYLYPPPYPQYPQPPNPWDQPSQQPPSSSEWPSWPFGPSDS